MFFNGITLVSSDWYQIWPCYLSAFFRIRSKLKPIGIESLYGLKYYSNDFNTNFNWFQEEKQLSQVSSNVKPKIYNPALIRIRESLDGISQMQNKLARRTGPVLDICYTLGWDFLYGMCDRWRVEDLGVSAKTQEPIKSLPALQLKKHLERNICSGCINIFYKGAERKSKIISWVLQIASSDDLWPIQIGISVLAVSGGRDGGK